MALDTTGIEALGFNQGGGNLADMRANLQGTLQQYYPGAYRMLQGPPAAPAGAAPAATSAPGAIESASTGNIANALSSQLVPQSQGLAAAQSNLPTYVNARVLPSAVGELQAAPGLGIAGQTPFNPGAIPGLNAGYTGIPMGPAANSMQIPQNLVSQAQNSIAANNYSRAATNFAQQMNAPVQGPPIPQPAAGGNGAGAGVGGGNGVGGGVGGVSGGGAAAEGPGPYESFLNGLGNIGGGAQAGDFAQAATAAQSAQAAEALQAQNPSFLGINFGRRVGTPTQDFMEQTFNSPQEFIQGLKGGALEDGEQVGLPGMSNFLNNRLLTKGLSQTLPEGEFTGAQGLEAAGGIGVDEVGGLSLAGSAAASAALPIAAIAEASPISNEIAGSNPADTGRSFLGDVAATAGIGGAVGGVAGTPIAGIGALPGALIGGGIGAVVGGVGHLLGHSFNDQAANAQANQQQLSPDDALANEFKAANLPPDMQSGIQKLYDVAVAGDGSDAGKKNALQTADTAIQSAVQQQQTAETQLSNTRNQALAMQSLYGKIMSPIQQQIGQGNMAYASLMNNLIPNMPASFQPIARAGVASQLSGSNDMSAAYMTQAFASPQMQQLALQQQLNLYSADVANRYNINQQLYGGTGLTGTTSTNLGQSLYPALSSLGSYSASNLPTLPSVSQSTNVSLPK